jgi:hypothetical protein
MRQDGQWPHRDLEPGTSINQIRNNVLPNGVIRPSGLRYTCDEFPPATWIEGGNGEFGTNSAETRCAAFFCSKGYKGEQNWQAFAHDRLQSVLKGQILDRKQRDPSFAPGYSKTVSKQFLAMFTFAMDTRVDGIAARITVYEDATFANINGAYSVTQAKRAMDGENLVNTTYDRDTGTVTPERLAELIKLGHATEHLVHANESENFDLGSIADLTGTVVPMSWMGLDKRWDDVEDEDEDELVDFPHTPKPTSSFSKRRLGFENITEPLLPSAAPVLRNVTGADLERARHIVEQAILESSRRNEARLSKPLRNQYELKPGSVIGNPKVQRFSAGVDAISEVTPLLEITDEIASAAALVAEADATGRTGNLTSPLIKKRATGSYWMGSIGHKGSVPWGKDASYKVFRNVRDYGAVGDGVTDDTKAFKNAMSDGKRCAVKCNGSTVKNAIVYIPPGTYLISSTIALPFGTQVIGDAIARPTLKASKSFIGMGVLSTDEYTGGGTGSDGLDQQYFINTANFYRQLRNLVIDVTATRASSKVACVHYQVAQATSTQNLLLIAGPTGYGMYAENGSGGQISDIEFQGGAVGLYGGSQQFTAQRLKFSGCTVGVQLIWDWGWVWKSIEM